MVAAYRGRVSAWERPLVRDPWATALAGDSGLRDAEHYDEAHAHMELYMAVRTAFLDAQVGRAIEDGVSQIVILGAGYDTRAARLARAGVRFFEVDQPSTQAEKRAAVSQIARYPVDAAIYVACDFEHADFVDALCEAGFGLGRPAVFLWEGVVYYLSESAVRATLRRIAVCHPESRLFFDYVGKRFVDGNVGDPKDAQARQRVAEMGEPLRFGINDVVPLLYEEGFRYVDTVSFDEACLALTGTYDRARKFRFQSIAHARVRAPK